MSVICNHHVLTIPNHFTDDEILQAIDKISVIVNDAKSDSNILKFVTDDHVCISAPASSSSILSVTDGYSLTCGLLIKLKNSVDRLFKRTKLRHIEKYITPSELLYQLVLFHTIDRQSLKDNWDPLSLVEASKELICKSINLSPILQKTLCDHPLHRSAASISSSSSLLSSSSSPSSSSIMTSSVTNSAVTTSALSQPMSYFEFDSTFLSNVHEYHQKLTRPIGTFDDMGLSLPSVSLNNSVNEIHSLSNDDCNQKSNDTSDNTIDQRNTDMVNTADNTTSNNSNTDNENVDIELIKQLAQLKREICPLCNGKRQVYCGDCGAYGVRMNSADCLLPPRIDLPFNVLLIVHWHETLHKCTGVHVGVLTTLGTLECVAWRKGGDEEEEVDHEVDGNSCKDDKNSNAANIDCTESNIGNLITSDTKYKNGKRKGKSKIKSSEVTDAHTSNNADINNISNSNDANNSRGYDTSNHSSTSNNYNISENYNSFTNNSHTFSKNSNKPPVWADIVLSLNADSDVLLFPSATATDAESFNWSRNNIQSCDDSDKINSESCSSDAVVDNATNKDNITTKTSSFAANDTSSDDDNSSNIGNRLNNPNYKWRLIVLEASWQHAKSMVTKINLYRAAHHLPPLLCVRLNNITGQYWRSQSEGHAAVSSVEAIAYAAAVAANNINKTLLSKSNIHSGSKGSETSNVVNGIHMSLYANDSSSDNNNCDNRTTTTTSYDHNTIDAAKIFDTLLLLFRLQKYRVLQRVYVDKGRPPKTMQVTGNGIGAWR